MSRSLNKVQLIGNLTRDPELRYTPQGTAVCSFGIATNRQWTTDSGEKREDVEFHKIVSWQKLAELCAQLLTKGRKVFVEGRLQTRRWQTQDGQDRTTTEIVINEMIILDSRGQAAPGGSADFDIPEDAIDNVDDLIDEPATPKKPASRVAKSPGRPKATAKTTKKPTQKTTKKAKEEPEDIPF